MEMSEIYNGSQWAHDIFLVNKAGAKENITGRSSTLDSCAEGKHSVIFYPYKVLLCLLTCYTFKVLEMWAELPCKLFSSVGS